MVNVYISSCKVVVNYSVEHILALNIVLLQRDLLKTVLAGDHFLKTWNLLYVDFEAGKHRMKNMTLIFLRSIFKQHSKRDVRSLSLFGGIMNNCLTVNVQAIHIKHGLLTFWKWGILSNNSCLIKPN